jgi:hypothetical protein
MYKLQYNIRSSSNRKTTFSYLIPRRVCTTTKTRNIHQSPPKQVSPFIRCSCQILFEIESQRHEFVRGHDGTNGRLELSLGVEFLELIQVDTQILFGQLVISGSDPLVSQGLIGIHSVRGTHRQKRTNEILGVRRYLSPVLFVEFVLSLADFSKELALVLFNKGRVATQQDVHNDSQTPHVRLHIVRRAFQNFGGHVARGPTLRRERLGAVALFGKSKIRNLDIGVVRVRLYGYYCVCV